MVKSDTIKLNVIIKLDIDTKVIFEIILTIMLNMNYLIKHTDNQVQSLLVSCRRQGMLTQGPPPDPKCKLNISSFLTLPRH